MTPRPVKAGSTVRDRQREDTRQRIYEAAMAVFRRDGFATARIEDIARSAGVSHGSFYFHFPTKDDVLFQHHRELDQRVVAALSALPEDAPLRVLLDTLCAAFSLEWERDSSLVPDLAAAMIRRGMVRTPPAEMSPVGRLLTERFRLAADRGELGRALPMEWLCSILLGQLFTTTIAWLAEPALPLSTALQRTAALFLTGASASR
ncbi:TetR/AcrR family transcriptional regulator [Sorangium sp. So ce394]|uniref:TetR/AcrR family transcriptional regulator n=1 Tax=Sorangium sp. So ce394 TaxID=3133310 RepID=UPI003F5B4C71